MGLRAEETVAGASNRVEALMVSLRERLRPICAEWPEQDFEAMIRQLAEVTLKYEGRSGNSLYDRRATDALRGEIRETLRKNTDAESSPNERDDS